MVWASIVVVINTTVPAACLRSDARIMDHDTSTKRAFELDTLLVRNHALLASLSPARSNPSNSSTFSPTKYTETVSPVYPQPQRNITTSHDLAGRSNGNEISRRSHNNEQDSASNVARGETKNLLVAKNEASLPNGAGGEDSEDILAVESVAQGVTESSGTHSDASQDDESITSASSPPYLHPPTTATRNASSWLPISLQFYYLVAVISVSIALEIVCVTLLVYSQKNSGLVNAGNTNGFLFSWRFMPTIVAVLYTLLWIPIMKDVLRSEPWALLSLPGGSTASASLLKGDGSWWTEIAHAIRAKGHVGGIRWAVILAILGSMTSSVILNPLSAGFFDIDKISTTQQELSTTVVYPPSLAPFPHITDVTYMKVISALLFNVSTSAWVKDNYAIMPFWPSSLTNAPFGARLDIPTQSWQGISDVFKVQMDCNQLTPVIAGQKNTTLTNGNISSPIIALQSDDGCSFEVSDADNSIAIGTWDQFNGTSDCGLRDRIYLQSPSATPLGIQNPVGNGSYLGYICNTQFLTARMLVNVALSGSNFVASVDDEVFNRTKRTMDSNFLSVAQFGSSFISETSGNHLQYLPLQTTATIPKLEGPLQALAAQNNLDVNALMARHDLVERATVVKQRFFAEVLLSVWSNLKQSNNTAAIPISVSLTTDRLLVTLWVGIAICIIFLILILFAISLLYLTRLKRRPLQLKRDPSTIKAAALAIQGSEAAGCFEGLDRVATRQMQAVLGKHIFLIRDGKVIRVDNNPAVVLPQRPSKTPLRSKRQPVARDLGLSEAKYTREDWRPLILRRWIGSLLVLFLISTIVGLSAMYAVSRGPGLYESALVYQTEFKLGGYRFGALAPYSIVPTLIAVLVKMWWEAIDDTFRTLTPFLAIAHRPRKLSDSVNLSYAVTPILLVTAKAAWKGHWLLFMVTFGTFTAEALQVFMSALWTREAGSVAYNVDLSQNLVIRTLPHVFQSYAGSFSSSRALEWPDITPYLYGGAGYQGSWLFDALAQSAYNSSPPAFSKNGWGFPIVNLTSIAASSAAIRAANPSDPTNLQQGSALNVTFNSPALSGRIECSSITDSGQWFSTRNLTDAETWDISSNPTNLQVGYELSSLVRLNYFTTYSDQPTPLNVSVGQWLPHGYGTLDDIFLSTNMTVLWMNASYPHQYLDTTDGPARLIFAEKPQITALNCMTILEAANASVTVSVSDGSVQEYKLLDNPRNATEAWSEFDVHYASEAAYDTPSGVPQYNTTVSWGYLFQMALREASSSPAELSFGVSSNGEAPFSFQGSDLYSDFYSYASLALVNYDRESLLNADILANVSTTVFSTFYQSFVSLLNGYDGGYWAYQQVGAELPLGLDFEPRVTITEPVTETSSSLLCSISLETTDIISERRSDGTLFPVTLNTTESHCIATGTVVVTSTYTTVIVTYPHTAATSTTSIAATNASVQPTTSIPPHFNRRAAPSSAPTASPATIHATLTLSTTLLVLSPLAVFFSAAILLSLILVSLVVYLQPRTKPRALPRDVNSAGSVLGLVYASEKLQAWALQDEKGWSVKGERGEREGLVSLGYFRGADGAERWGVELHGERAGE